MSEQRGTYAVGSLPGMKQLIETTPRPEVQWFARRMEKKLQANDHKQHWSKCNNDYLIHRLYQEAHELWSAIQNGEPIENIISEAADVANFALMIADNAGMKRG